MGVGESFGELSLLTKQRRAATVRCLESSKFAILSKTDYRWSIGQAMVKKLREDVLLCRQFRFLKLLRAETINKIYAALKEVTFSHGHIVYTQGSPVHESGAYFIMDGEFEVTQLAVTEKTVTSLTRPQTPCKNAS